MEILLVVGKVYAFSIPREIMGYKIAKPLLGDDEIEQVTRVINSGMIASGPETLEFEREFSEFTGTRYSCAVTNGTVALSVALSACGVGPGDEVITSPFTFVATANAILSCGATPVFADIDDKNMNISTDAARNSITNKTKAIIPVHLYGCPADMYELESISKEFGLRMIGDAAQAHGAKIGERSVGSFGDMECFSFYPTKNMTTGEGGMITTSDEELYKIARSIMNHGRTSNTLGTYEYERFGLNCRLTDISSAIGRVQLSKLTEFNASRASNASRYNEKLTGISGLILPEVPEGVTHSWHQYTIRSEQRDFLRDKLTERDIGTAIYYPRPLFHYSHLSRFSSDCPNAERACNEVLSLPVHPSLSKEDIDKISMDVIDILES